MEIIKDYLPYKKLLKHFLNGEYPISVEGPDGFFLAILIDSLKKYHKGEFLIVLPTEKEAKELYRDLYLMDTEITYLPSWESIPYSGINPQASIFGERSKCLCGILTGKIKILITSLRAFLIPVPPPEYMKKRIISLKMNDSIDPVSLETELQALGFLRVSRVGFPGEFALRGEVLDIFPYGYDEAVRIVFDFNIIENIKYFDPSTQFTTGKLDKFLIFPVKEVHWTDERISELKRKSDIDKNVIEELQQKHETNGEELYFPSSFKNSFSILDYMSDNCVVFYKDKERLDNSFRLLKKEFVDLYKKYRFDRKMKLPLPDTLILDFGIMFAKKKRSIIFPSIGKKSDVDSFSVKFHYDGPRSFFGNVKYLKEELGSLIDNKYKVFIFAESESQAKRIEHLLRDFDITIINNNISSGFSLPDLNFIAIQENEIFGRRKRIPGLSKKIISKPIDTFVDLNPGDYVVHINYGIGKFLGIERIEALGTNRDYIKLEYSGDEIIFIPIEQVNLIQKYIGQGGGRPSLDKIGGKSWENRKNRVKKSVEDLAERLLLLYSKRKKAKGFAYPHDTDWQVEFEASFPFEETRDQLKSIEEIKIDMESPKPMDRLLCGDVGYGKTEIAMRAAFKAVSSGKQVAVLAPTTVLAEQHYENFIERFKRFPVEIAMLSRFVPKSKQKKVLEKLLNGSVDLVIGTHRLLQKDVIFKNIGLFVIDEEQRFGVKDKEKLKEYKTSIDSLSLSATPIPRTLHMSLLKIRDMSILSTPPQNRLPIETFIEEFSDSTIRDAIRRETQRNGQVFYLHNRVESLDIVRLFLEKLVPEVIIRTAHGRMNSSELEDVMHDFIHGNFQVLVSTTIIENGIDIPNVNTIIIDRADMYGISQLYQLRGRVGRSDKLAYAYLLYPQGKPLTEIAMKRLKIISNFTELGSGFKIALKDLEVRGAGNLLGRQQSGEIASIGFDLYLRLLDRAISELSDDKKDEVEEVFLELEYSGFIPDSYIESPMAKMEIYKKISSITTEEELGRIVGELEDKFGSLPEEIQSLLSIAEIRIICKKLSIVSLKEKSGKISITFGRVSKISVNKVLKLIKENAGRVFLDSKNPQILNLRIGAVELTEKSEFIREKLASLL